MANEVKLVISGKDETGAAFTGAEARSKAFEAATTKSFASQARAAKLLSDPLVQATQDTEAWEKASVDAAGTLHVLTGKTDELSQSSLGLGERFGALAGTGGGGISGMGALIGAGVALSPVLVTLGFGLGGLGAAAVGVLDPIKKAATATGGLQKNMHTLDPEQQAAARSLLGLEKGYDSFQAALKPQVLGAWNEGLKIAGHLMGDVEPVAKATGNALDQVLGSVDKEFQSGSWQQFFGFMAQQAGPDMRLLGANLVDVTKALPPLLEDLQPLGQGLLTVTDDAAKAAGGIAQFYQSFEKNVPVSNEHAFNALKDLDHWTVELTNHIPGAHAVNDWLTSVQHNLDGTSASAAKAVSPFRSLGTVTGDLIHPLGSVSSGLLSAAKNADTEDAAARRTATGIGILTSALAKGLSPLQSYIGATITQANDARAMEKALHASGDRIGYNTQKQRDSFAAAQTYIGDLSTTATAAIASHEGIDKQITSISNALPALENVQGKTAAYNTELGQLKTYLDELRAEANIVKYVTIVGSVEHISPGGGLPGGVAGGFAHGGITGAASGGARGGRVLVGEYGPELVDLPSGSTVHSGPDTQGMLGGGGGTLKVQLEWAPGGGTDSEFMTWLAKNIRIRGGDPRILTSKVSALT